MVNMLNLASAELGSGADFAPTLIKFYIHALSNGDISPENISNYLNSDLNQGKAKKEFLLRDVMWEESYNILKRSPTLAKQLIL